jgi:hypothetical protein
MLIKSILERAKSLASQFSKPQTYGSGLEYYIVSNNPQSEGDVDRLTREYHSKSNEGYIWARGF